MVFAILTPSFHWEVQANLLDELLKCIDKCITYEKFETILKVISTEGPSNILIKEEKKEYGVPRRTLGQSLSKGELNPLKSFQTHILNQI